MEKAAGAKSFAWITLLGFAIFFASRRHNFKLACYWLCTEPNENMNQRAEWWNRTGFAQHQQDFIWHWLNWRELFGEENCRFMPRETTVWSTDFYTCITSFLEVGRVGPFKEITKKKHQRVDFIVQYKFKITCLFLTDPYSSLWNNIQCLWDWHDNHDLNFWPKFCEMKEIIGFDHYFWPLTRTSFITLKILQIWRHFQIYKSFKVAQHFVLTASKRLYWVTTFLALSGPYDMGTLHEITCYLIWKY